MTTEDDDHDDDDLNVNLDLNLDLMTRGGVMTTEEDDEEIAPSVCVIVMAVGRQGHGQR